MTGQEVAFLILAVIGGLAGLLVVTSRNVVHAALYLVVALASVAGVYLLLAAPFVAFVQVIIYVGAIVVLILFGIMLTRAPVGRRVLDNTLRARVGAFVVGAGVFVMLTVFLAGRVRRGAHRQPGRHRHRRPRRIAVPELRAALRGGQRAAAGRPDRRHRPRPPRLTTEESQQCR